MTLAGRQLSVVVVPSSGVPSALKCDRARVLARTWPGQFDLIRLQTDPTQFILVRPNSTFSRPILIVYGGFKVYFWITIVSGLAYHLFVIFMICLYLIIY